MARSLNNTNQCFGAVGASIGAFLPLTFSAWGRWAPGASAGVPFIQTDAAHTQYMQTEHNPGGGNFDILINDGAGQVGAGGGGPLADNTWINYCGWWTTTDMANYMNGSAVAAGAYAKGVPATTQTGLGGWPSNPGQRPWSGPLAHVAVWNVVLSPIEIATLGVGVSPLRIRRNALVEYWPLNRLSGGERGIVSGIAMPEVNGPIGSFPEPVPQTSPGFGGWIVQP